MYSVSVEQLRRRKIGLQSTLSTLQTSISDICFSARQLGTAEKRAVVVEVVVVIVLVRVVLVVVVVVIVVVVVVVLVVVVVFVSVVPGLVTCCRMLNVFRSSMSDSMAEPSSKNYANDSANSSVYPAYPHVDLLETGLLQSQASLSMGFPTSNFPENGYPDREVPVDGTKQLGYPDMGFPVTSLLHGDQTGNIKMELGYPPRYDTEEIMSNLGVPSIGHANFGYPTTNYPDSKLPTLNSIGEVELGHPPKAYPPDNYPSSLLNANLRESPKPQPELYGYPVETDIHESFHAKSSRYPPDNYPSSLPDANLRISPKPQIQLYGYPIETGSHVLFCAKSSK
ncbi:hypothetical protein ElyMa_006759500 [Elysia marginata]|uniref:Uncharacterized protein n=1 Tax=Elysia marginata TaxID=1093978 RepID=A0AAV4IZ08_9GAST|nr:hypothetical protein ElyMa_006759500 [Elysia marginata]